MKKHDSIVFKLIAAIIVIFVIMVFLSMYLINRKQSMVIDAVIEEFETNMPFTDKNVILLVNSSKIEYTSDFRIYLFFVMAAVSILGSFAFALIIKRILRPLKDLEEKIIMVDIDKPESFENNLLIDNTSSEIVELSRSFDRMLKRIYRDYKRQKDFSSNVAHELRTPIAVMKSQIDLFKEKNKDDQTQRLVRVMEANVDKLNSLVDAILSLRKKAEAQCHLVDLDGLIDEIILDLEDKADNMDVKIFYEESGLDLMTDDSLLQRLIYNIVDNAIKYNIEGGSVDISTKNLGDFIEISIKDTGIGIGEADQERIYDLFYQVDPSRGVEGFGIGLSLSKTIADILKAKIIIRENEPKGSNFIIKIPKSLQ